MVAGEPVMVLTAGDQRADDRKIAARFDVGRKKVRLADAETTIEVTGYPPGGVPPVGHRQTIPIFIDATLGRYDIVYAAAGTASTIFPIAYADLVRVTGGTVIEVAREQ
jgi:prolyl-tRNA editing enzyme YbaK/EbsC (Cys-tRNA(Pro) deacylase)